MVASDVAQYPCFDLYCFDIFLQINIIASEEFGAAQYLHFLKESYRSLGDILLERLRRGLVIAQPPLGCLLFPSLAIAIPFEENRLGGLGIATQYF